MRFDGRRLGFMLLAAAGMLAACQPATAPAATTVAPAGPTAASPPTAPATVAATAEAAATGRPLRTALEATDPTTVSLANGRPTLVEFFAFW